MFDEDDDFDTMVEMRAEAARLFVPVDDGWDEDDDWCA